MELTLLKGKIHRCTVTQANLNYEGSVTISEDLMEAAGIIEHEQVHVWNVTSGTRVTTYAMRGARDSGVICINGAGAHLIHVGDIVIIAAFVQLSQAEASTWKPSIVFVDERNRVRVFRNEAQAGPGLPPL